MQRRHSSMRLSAAGWIIATASLTVSVVSCYTRCNSCRTPLRVSSQGQKYEHVTPVPRELNWLPVGQRITYKTALLWSINAVWCHPTLHHSVYLRHSAPTDSTSDLLVATNFTFHERARTMHGQRRHAIDALEARAPRQ